MKLNVRPEKVSVLDRLAIVGKNGMGALTYEPEQFLSEESSIGADYDELCEECERILNSDFSQSESDRENLDQLFLAGGSSGGARPKVFAKINGKEWIIKFPSSVDSKEIGLQEYEYNKCAEKYGIETSECELFPSKRCSAILEQKDLTELILAAKKFLWQVPPLYWKQATEFQILTTTR